MYASFDRVSSQNQIRWWYFIVKTACCACHFRKIDYQCSSTAYFFLFQLFSFSPFHLFVSHLVCVFLSKNGEKAEKAHSNISCFILDVNPAKLKGVISYKDKSRTIINFQLQKKMQNVFVSAVLTHYIK